MVEAAGEPQKHFQVLKETMVVLIPTRFLSEWVLVLAVEAQAKKVYSRVVAEAVAVALLYLQTRKTQARQAAQHQGQEAAAVAVLQLLTGPVAVEVVAATLTERVLHLHRPGETQLLQSQKNK